MAEGLLWSSKCQLKSPTITRFPGCVPRTSRYEANSLRNAEVDDLFLEEGGRAIDINEMEVSFANGDETIKEFERWIG